MTTIAEVEVLIRARLDPLMKSSTQAEKVINALDRKLASAGRKAAPAFKAATNEIDRLRSSVSQLAVGVGAAFGVREIQQYADAWTEAGNKLRAAAEIAGVQTRSLEDLNNIAADTRTGLTETVDLYAKLIRSASGVAKSEEEIAIATATVNKAFKAGGATIQEQISGITQLGQALGSGILQGDELRSLRENAPIIAEAIAKEFGVTIAGLKKLGEEGKLTSDRVFKAIVAAQGSVQAAFSKTNATIGDSFTLLSNKVTEYIGHMDQTLGITTTVNNILGALTNNIGAVANAAAAASIVLLSAFGSGSALAAAGALLNPWVALAAAVGVAAYAVTQFWDEIVPLQNSFATLGDYAQVFWEGITTGATMASDTVVSAFDTLLGAIGGALTGVEISFEDLLSGIRGIINQIIQNHVNMKDAIAVAFETLPGAIAGAVIEAMNTMTSYVIAGVNNVIGAVNSAISAINSLGSVAGIGSIEPFKEFSLDTLELTNSYKDAGQKASDAFNEVFTRETQDYVGMAGDAIATTVDNVTQTVVQRANEIRAAKMELERETNRAANFGGIKPTISDKGFGTGSGAGSGSGSGKKAKQSDYQKEIEQIKERTAALVAETEAQRQVNPLIEDYGFAGTQAKAAQELLTAAQKSGIAVGKELTDVQKLLKGEFEGLSPAAREQAQAILDLATGYGNATVASKQLEEQQERTKKQFEDFRDSSREIFGNFISDMKDGKSASEALGNALSSLADKLLNSGLDALFGTGNFQSSGGGIFSSLLSSIFGGFKASGGPVSSNKAYVVGEKGPEVFSPGSSGVIIPNHQLSPNVASANTKPQQIEIVLQTNTDTGVITQIADTRIKNSAPAIVKASVSESQKQTKANMPGYIANSQTRQL